MFLLSKWNRLEFRVHITEDTLDRLDNRFEVEPGDGHLRDSYLAQHAIKTYLIIDPNFFN
ncbi:hypothetical protein QR98_0001640 [Sarcoptes scabiei]|uniref:Uncharacterized protein n=1 Tax=Sarcoptes scabiei TaxID=52283 RepID=A0A131ZTY8_SARSC|nr:hypothetical protein QR98_0001640 [Sarcoptes scabiei]